MPLPFIEMSNLRTIALHFQRSINLTYDAGNADYIAGYIPTPNSAKTLVDILGNTIEGKNQRAHVLHAAYGSGKSLLGLVCSALIDQNDMTKTSLDLVIERLYHTFPIEAQQIASFRESKRHLLPVLLSGNEGDLNTALTRALTQTLSQRGFGDLYPRTQFQAALSTIRLWEKTYPVAYNHLRDKLHQENTDLASLWHNLETMQPEALSFFERLYPDLTAGAKFDIYAGQPLTTAFHDTAMALHEKGFDGIMIIWDEFGRFIESRVNEAFGAEASLLQSFAEFCNRSGEYQVHLILITHRLLSGYAAQLPLTYQQEWARIAERFHPHNITSDPQIVYRLIADALTTPKTKIWQGFVEQYRSHFYSLTAQSVDLALFPEVDDVTLRQHIIEPVWPLHPLTVYALPRLSSHVAQNERTLFTFLASDEPNSLNYYMSQSHYDWWTVGLDALWDYFADVIQADIGPGGCHSIWSGVMNTLGKISDNDTISIAIVKALGILLIVGDVNIQMQSNGGHIVPNTKLLAWGLNLTEKDVLGRLNTLARRQAVVLRQSDGYWSFTKGSDIDIEASIADVIEHHNPTDTQMRQLLEKYVPIPFMLPREYNQKNGMTRFFFGMYRWVYEITNLTSDNFLNQLGIGYADGAIIYVLVKNQVEQKEVVDVVLTKSKKGRVIYIIPEQPLLIFDLLREIFALQELENNTIFMEKDERLTNEIKFFIKDAEHRLKRTLQPLLTQGKNKTTFYWPNGRKWEKIQPHTEVDISLLLSHLCNSWFDKTPILNNEMLNQQEPSNQQVRAAEKVIDALFDYPDGIFPPNLNMSGFGPNYFVFRTILVVPGLLQPIGNDDTISGKTTWKLGRPTNNKKLAHIWDTGQEFLKTALEEEQEAAELLSILQLPPYGLRRGVLPVLLSAIIHPHLHVITVRKNRKIIFPLTGEILTELCQNPEKFTIEVGTWEEQHKILWKVLQKQFHDFGSQEKGQQPLSYLSLALLRWLQALPRFCRDTNHISSKANHLRKLIRKAQRNPARVLLYDLLELLTYDTDDISDAIAYHRVLTERLSQLMGEISTTYQSLLYQLDNFAESKFTSNTPILQRHGQAILSNWLTQLEQHASEPLETFRFSDAMVQRFVEAIKNEKESHHFWEYLSYAIMGIYPYDWNDGSIDIFKQNLLDARNRLERELLELTNDEDIVELSINLPGTEEEHIYRFRPSAISSHGNRILQNFISTLKIAGRPLSPDEQRQVVLALLHYVMEGTDSDVE